jgi:acyl dehydratase
MPIDPEVAIGAELPDRTFAWTESDALLYHLAIGATDLRSTLEDGAKDRPETAPQQVLPSFAVVLPTFHETNPPPLDLPGCDIDLAQVVHGAQEVRLHRAVPTSGAATLHTRITDVWDKSRAAVIWQEGTAVDDAGTELWTVRSSIFVKGEGGWGGDRGSATAVGIPDREPDLTASYDVSPTQALLYRLCGDRNPLHADPDFAARAGFPAPILHGLCTYGIVLRELVDGLLDGDSATAAGWSARFAGVVFPGETLHVRGWREDDRIGATATVGADERPALADCVLSLSR